MIRYDKRGADRGLARPLAAGRVGSAARGYRAGVPAAPLAGARRRWRCWPARRSGSGSPTARRRVTYTRRVPRPASGHEVERLLALAERRRAERAAGPACELTAEDRAAADAWLASAGVGAGFVALAPGSIWGTKRWPDIAELAAALDTAGRGGGRPGRRGAGRRGRRPRRRAGRTARRARSSLRASAALIARAAVLVTNDSAPLHLATAVGTPVVALFGPTVPAFGFGPRGAGDRRWSSTRRWPAGPARRTGPRLPAGSSSLHAGAVGRAVAAAVAAVSWRGGASRAIRPRH